MYVVDIEDGTMIDPQEWIDNIGELHLDEYFKIPEENFWDGVGKGETVFHGTNEENSEIIEKEGLKARNVTRGLSNRGTGNAIFTSPTYEKASYYYDVVWEIDLGDMKQDGYMPPASGEEPLQESEHRAAIANLIGYDGYIKEDKLLFDYKLKKGICQSFNALILMRKMGIEL